jgi:hypothetical protein
MVGNERRCSIFTILMHTKVENHGRRRRRRIEFIYLTNPGSVTRCSQGGTRRGHGGGVLLAVSG